MLALTFTLVIAVVFDPDQPKKGLIDMSQRRMQELHEGLQADG